MGMIGKNRRMAVLFLLAFRFVRLLLSGHQGVALERSAPNANRRFSAEAQAAAADNRGPGILDYPPESMGQLAQAVALRPARHGCAMAARAVPEILGSALQAAAPGPRSPQHERRTPSINCTNGRRQSAVARTQNSWRTQDARYRHLRTHCLTPPAQTPPPAEPDLEDIPAQPYRSHGVDRFLYRADHHDEGAVRIHCPGT